MVQADFVLIYRVFSAKPAWKIVPKNSILRRLLTDEINVQAEHLNQFMYGTNLNHINGLRQLRRIQKSKNLKIYCFLFYEYDGVGLSLVTSPSIVASPLSFTLRNTGRFTWYILKLLTLSHSVHVCFTWVVVDVYKNSQCFYRCGCLNCTWLSKDWWNLNDLSRCLHLTVAQLSLTVFSNVDVMSYTLPSFNSTDFRKPHSNKVRFISHNSSKLRNTKVNVVMYPITLLSCRKNTS